MKAKLIGESTGGMTAVEIYNGATLVWSHSFFSDGATERGYIDGLKQVIDDMLACEDVADFEGGEFDDSGNPVLIDDADTTGVVCEYDGAAGKWTAGDLTLGQSTEIPAALMRLGMLDADEELMEMYADSAVVAAVTDHLQAI